jgi:hypothetical protein
MWISGNRPAVATAKIVEASAARKIAVRQGTRRRNSTAEISVPACPMPTQKTKVVMNEPQLTGLLMPVTPMPVRIR